MKTYRGRILYLLPLLIFSLVITLIITLDEEFNSFVLLLLVPFILLSLGTIGYKLEVGEDHIRSSFLNFTLYAIQPNMVESLTYGNIGFWNSVHPHMPLTHGKGLAILVNINGVRKTIGISEKLYGKKAIQHIKSILDKNTSSSL